MPSDFERLEARLAALEVAMTGTLQHLKIVLGVGRDLPVFPLPQAPMPRGITAKAGG